MALSQELLEILVCPESKEDLVYFEQEGFLFCAPGVFLICVFLEQLYRVQTTFFFPLHV